MFCAGGLQLYLRFTTLTSWVTSDNIIHSFLSCTRDTPFHHYSSCVTGLLVSNWTFTVRSQAVLLWLDQRCTLWPAVLWCDMLVAEQHYESSIMIDGVYTYVYLSVYLSGFISLDAYFLLIQNSCRCDKWSALDKWVSRTYLLNFLKSITVHYDCNISLLRFIGIAPP